MQVFSYTLQRLGRVRTDIPPAFVKFFLDAYSGAQNDSAVWRRFHWRRSSCHDSLSSLCRLVGTEHPAGNCNRIYSGIGIALVQRQPLRQELRRKLPPPMRVHWSRAVRMCSPGMNPAPRPRAGKAQHANAARRWRRLGFRFGKNQPYALPR